ncbi:adenylyltransferase/cytidyltransferase family protein [Candidatus Gracilibacteria bacterium]|nr:adenylyltransferase/cytidyltransferase family protein [Candidatus Gracilibacteria bacterium]
MLYKKILVAGTFDRFHVGHQYFLWTAKGLAQEMVVIIARDTNVLRFKKHRSKYSETFRLNRIKKELKIKNISQDFVKVRLGREDANFWETIEEENPDMIYLGYDQRFDEEFCQKQFPFIEIKRAESYFPEFFKSSRF